MVIIIYFYFSSKLIAIRGLAPNNLKKYIYKSSGLVINYFSLYSKILTNKKSTESALWLKGLGSKSEKISS